MRFRLGHWYVSDIRIGVGPVTAMRGLVALVGQMGRRPSITRPLPLLPVAALPGSWSALPGMRWTPVGPDEVLVALPFRGGTETARCASTPTARRSPWRSGRTAIAAPRIGWQAEYPTGTGGRAGAAAAQWADEPEPWLDLRVETVVPNEPIEAHESRAGPSPRDPGLTVCHMPAGPDRT